MHAVPFNWPQRYALDDGLEALAPLAPGLPASNPAIARRAVWVPAAAAVAGIIVAVLITLSGSMAHPLVLALGATAAFLYAGTAMISAHPGAAALDVAAAVAAVGIAVTGAGPAVSVLLVHVVWGLLRGAWPGRAPGRRFAAAWAAFHATAALLLGFGAA
jgi:hypothetical protein